MKNQLFYKQNQHGVVLFVALIALVVMSLAAVALIRSVDTNTIIAGNLSFQQSALVSSDAGVEAAIAWTNQKIVGSQTALDADDKANGYLASLSAVDLDNKAILKTDATWTDNSVALAQDGAGNTVSYIIQRMCSATGAPTKENCLYASSEVDNSGKGGRSGPDCCEIIQAGESPVYRVTVRVLGPKNTVSYAQTYVY